MIEKIVSRLDQLARWREQVDRDSYKNPSLAGGLLARFDDEAKFLKEVLDHLAHFRIDDVPIEHDLRKRVEQHLHE